jgi:predicted DNA-binding transcriptional regulator YafY
MPIAILEMICVVFSLDGILSAKMLSEPAKQISENQLNEHYAQSYGIFSGKATQRAKLRFSPERARYIKKEQWHPKQTVSEDDEGFLTLEFDYHQDAELVMDIIKHGAHVEVLAPNDLKDKVCLELKKDSSKL